MIARRRKTGLMLKKALSWKKIRTPSVAGEQLDSVIEEESVDIPSDDIPSDDEVAHLSSSLLPCSC